MSENEARHKSLMSRFSNRCEEQRGHLVVIINKETFRLHKMHAFNGNTFKEITDWSKQYNNTYNNEIIPIQKHDYTIKHSYIGNNMYN